MNSSLGSELLRNAVIIWHVRRDSSEACVQADGAFLGRVGLDIAGSGDNFVVVCRVTIVLLNVLKVFHVLEVGLIEISSDVLSRSEGLLVANLDLSGSIFFSNHGKSSLLKGITDTSVGARL